MNADEPTREYYDFAPSAGYPAASDLFYECLRCGDVVPSLPADSTFCECRNIMIDVDYGRIKMREPTKVRLFGLRK